VVHWDLRGCFTSDAQDVCVCYISNSSVVSLILFLGQNACQPCCVLCVISCNDDNSLCHCVLT